MARIPKAHVGPRRRAAYAFFLTNPTATVAKLQEFLESKDCDACCTGKRSACEKHRPLSGGWLNPTDAYRLREAARFAVEAQIANGAPGTAAQIPQTRTDAEAEGLLDAEEIDLLFPPERVK